MVKMRGWLRQWLGVEVLTDRVTVLEAEVERLKREPPTVKETGETPTDIRRFRCLHRLNEALRGEEVV